MNEESKAKRAEQWQRYYAANKAKVNEQRKRYYAANKKKANGWHVARTYGLTVAEFELMKTQQGNQCAICKKTFGLERDRVATVDHDHSTHEIRGLVCLHCNALLGHANDDPEILQAAIRYLETRQAPLARPRPAR